MRSEANKLERKFRRLINELPITSYSSIIGNTHRGISPQCRWKFTPSKHTLQTVAIRSLWPGRATNVGKLVMGTLEDWSKVYFEKRFYPELPSNYGFVLDGYLSGDKRKTRTTAVIDGPATFAKGSIVETVGGIYILGEERLIVPRNIPCTTSSG